MTKVTTSTTEQSDGFFVASFAIDGSLEGFGRWNNHDLSSKWINICKDLLNANSENFNYKWKESLSHIRVRFTSSRGTAICTFFVNDQIASLILLMRGQDNAAEHDTSRLFVNSLQKVPLAQASTTSTEPFKEILSMPERPLMVVAPLPIDAISDHDHSLVRELSLHLASVFLGEDR